MRTVPIVVCTRLIGQGQPLALAVRALLQVLAEHYAEVRRTAAPLPRLYESGIRYRREPNAGDGSEEFADPWTVAKRGWGDCDDLILYRVSELLSDGEAASVNAVWDETGERLHVRVRRASGAKEDPSRIQFEKLG